MKFRCTRAHAKQAGQALGLAERLTWSDGLSERFARPLQRHFLSTSRQESCCGIDTNCA